MHVTKQEFVDRVADKSGLSKRDASEAVDAFLDSITEVLRGGGEVAFTGFGKFTTQRRAARQGVNPRNPSQRVQIPATTVPKFSAGSQLSRPSRAAAAGTCSSHLTGSFQRATAYRGPLFVPGSQLG
jgi:DNA-binding protein HU-beta